MTIQSVVIVDQSNGIGKNNQLLCHMPADLKHFKSLTVGHPVIMGRKTFESMGKALPNRRNIVISTQDMQLEGCDVINSLEAAVDACRGQDRISVIGGATIFEQTMNMVDTIHLTCIHHTFEADTFFPNIDSEIWEITSKEDFKADEKNHYDYSFITYKRR